MANGYMGSLLNVNLTEGKIAEEKLSDGRRRSAGT